MGGGRVRFLAFAGFMLLAASPFLSGCDLLDDDARFAARGSDPAPARHFVVTANTEGDSLSVFGIDRETGALSAIENAALAAGSAPTMVLLSPDGRFLFCANSSNWDDTATIGVFAFDSATGHLAEIAGSPFDVGGIIINMAIDPTGKYLYTTDQSQYLIRIHLIDSATGALTEASFSPIDADDTHGIAMHPSGDFLFDGSEAGEIRAYRIDAATGEPTPAPNSPYSVSGAYVWLAVTPDGKFLYGAGAGFIAGFSIDQATGELTLLDGFPADAASDKPKSAVVDPSGRYLYTANFQSGTVGAYAIAADNGALTPVPNMPFASGMQPKSVAVDPTGRYLYAANYGDSTVTAFLIDSATGELASIGSYEAGPNPKFLAVLP